MRKPGPIRKFKDDKAAKYSMPLSAERKLSKIASGSDMNGIRMTKMHEKIAVFRRLERCIFSDAMTFKKRAAKVKWTARITKDETIVIVVGRTNNRSAWLPSTKKAPRGI